MRAARFLGNREAVVIDAPLPAPGPGEVLVELRAAAVCGSDLHRYRRPPADPPSTTLPGHEPVGLLRSLGDGVTGKKAVGEASTDVEVVDVATVLLRSLKPE